jgi:hypothetical protein
MMFVSAGLAIASEDSSSGGSAGNTSESVAGDPQDGSGGGNAVPSRSIWRRFQFHGTLAQSVIYGTGNNYLSMNTNDGTAKWSEGSVNLRTAITENFHAGIQVHSYVMGQIGRANVQVDWAFLDYRLKNWLGFRGGKLKAPMGLFGEIEDTDTLYNWALLPQGMYEAEHRSYNVPVVGGAIYGNVKLPVGGSVAYQLFGGKRGVTANDGSPLLTWQLYRIAQGAMSGYTYGGDFKWKTPIRGLIAGVSYDNSRGFSPHADWPVNPYGVPLVLRIESAISREIYSVEFQRGKLDLAAEGKHEPHWVANNGAGLGTSPRNAWYVMGSYHFTDKLTLGSYFSRAFGTSFNETFRWAYYDPSKPEFYSNDTVVNARYDLNRFFYAKLEGHYIDGDLGGFFPATNPQGLQKITCLFIARVGFTF